MTRDPNRIDEIIECLRLYWKEHPELRLTQIVTNMAWVGSGHGNDDRKGFDPFYVEDGNVLMALKMALIQHRKRINV